MRRRRRFAALLVGTVACLSACLGGAGLHEAFASQRANTWTGIANGEVLVSDTVTPLANGAVQHEVVANRASGDHQNIEYFAEVDLAEDDIKIVAGYGQNSADEWSLTRTTDQAKAYERDNPGKTVVAAINADFFNMATGEPMGALVMEGEVCHPNNGRWYFGITKDGEPVIRNSSDLSDLQMAVGGNSLLVEDGKPLPLPEDGFQNITYSRCAIGIREDGSILTVTSHGNFAPTSHGRPNTEIAQMMANAGCVKVLELDAGGSATFASRAEGEEGLTVKNSPRDGAERYISSSILIVSSSTPTGEFDHASLSPNNEAYTPGSEVAFTAKGVDTAGAPTDLPEGIAFQLADNSKELGTIDASTGVFKAGDQEGTVTVETTLDGSVVGSTTIEIVKPDEIYFASDEVNLGFNETSDLGVVVRSEKREIHYNDGDLIWTISDPALGSFEGNLFISSNGSDLHGTATVVSKWDDSVRGEVKVNVGVQPTIVWDFEDVESESGEVTSAEDYYIGTEENPGILSHSNYGRGGNESIEIVSIDDDEPVRFNEKSLKLNYDFTQCGEVTEGACIGTSEEFEIPGTPTGIGVWVYAPEGVGIEYEGDGSQAGFWLRGYVVDGAGNTQPYDFTLEPKNAAVSSGEEQPGIYWEGWKYLEADLTHLQAPYKIPASMTLRLMYVAGTKMGTKSANSIYFDNLQFVYGANDDDVDSPVIDSIMLNDVELEDGATIDTNVVNITTAFHDVENDFTSGIDPATVRLQIDGVNVLDNDKYEAAYDQSVNRAYLYECELLDGPHTVTVSMKDAFGNDASVTRHFTVDTGASDSQASVTVQPTSENAVIGKTVALEIRGSGATINKSDISISLGNRFPDYEVTFAQGYEGTSSYGKLTRTVSIEAERQPDAVTDDNLIATLTVDIPTDLKDGDVFNYTVKSSSFETSDGAYGTLAESEKKLPIVAPLTISADRTLQGKEVTITVTDTDGNPVEGAEISKTETGELVGTTDAEGKLVTDAFSAEAGNTVIVAKKGEEYSFEFTVSVYGAQGDETGKPDGIRFNVVEDPATQKSIGWLSSPVAEGKQVLRYAVKGSDAWTTVDAEGEQVYFSKNGNSSAIANSVVLEGLAPETTYEFSVGAEGAMSDTREFTTSASDPTSHSFFVIGDIQDQDRTNIETIIEQLGAGSYDFGAQTGDASDDPTLYEDWPVLGNLFGDPSLKGTEVISALGNHEYTGDADGSIASAIYHNDTTAPGSYWSVQYGDLYIAVMNYANNAAQMREAATWLEQDANASNAKWRVLFTHQPPYFTNSTGGNDIVYEILPDAIDKAGIDAVFSGHDHSATRTNPLKAGEQDEKGTVYYICGSTGGKEYSITSQGKFDYDKIFALATIDYSATYLTVSISGDTMAVDINDIQNGVIDSFEIGSKCHEPQLDVESGTVSCSRCGKVIENYTGSIKDADGNSYYFLSGKMQTGWVLIGQDYHFYADNGVEEKVTVKDELKSTCVIQGYTVYESESGSEKRVEGDVASGHEYEKQEDGSRVCSVCGWKYADLNDCDITLSNDGVSVYTGTPRKPIVTVTAPDGTVLTQTGEGKDYFTTYMYNDVVKIGKASFKLTAYKYGMYVDVNDWRGDCGGERIVTFDIVPPAPENAVLIKSDTSRATLRWDDAVVNGKEVADRYVVYVSDDGGKTFDEKGTTTSNSYTVTGLKPGVSYKFRIGSRCVVDGETFDSKTQAVPTYLKPTIAASFDEDGKPVLSWTGIDGVEYEIWRATGSGNFTKIDTTDGSRYVDSSARAGVTYRYKLKAIKGSDRVFSEVRTFECGCAKPTATVTSRFDGKPVIRWNKLDGAVKYEVYRSTSGVDGTFNLLYTGSGQVLTNSSAKAGTKYYYKVRGVTAAGRRGAFSDTVSITGEAARVEIEFSYRASDGYPTVSWSKVDGAARYEVWRSTKRVGSYRLISTTSGSKLTNVSIDEGTLYYYKVRPVASNGTTKGTFSNIVSGKFMGTEIVLEVSYRESDGVPVIEWNKVPGAAKYQVYRSTSGKTGTFNRLITTAGQKLINTSAKPGTTYYYKVRAVSKKGTLGAFSENVSAMRDPSAAKPDVTIANRISDGKPKLTWKAMSGATGYVVYVSTTGVDGEFTQLFIGKGTVLSHTSAQEGVDYTYKVQATFSDGQTSSMSDPVSASVVPVKIELQGANREGDGVPVLTWNKVDLAKKYEVWRSEDGEDGEFEKVISTVGIKLTNVSVEHGVTYTYKVRGVDADGATGAFSNTVDVAVE